MGWADGTASVGTVMWADNTSASSLGWNVPTGSPTTFGLMQVPLKPFDAGDGSLRFNLMCNDDAPIFLNDAWPFTIVDSGRPN